MKRYNVQAQTQDILESTTLMPNKYGGWLAVNTGTADCTIDGYTLAPGDGLDYTHLPADVIWNSPIKIILPSGGSVRITRLIYSEAR